MLYKAQATEWLCTVEQALERPEGSQGALAIKSKRCWFLRAQGEERDFGSFVLKRLPM